MTETAAATVASAQRVVRVFVSSTFRDMQAERDELVKHVFPRLRKLCESRGVIWGEVDLRWGITDEQKAEGKVLPICLAEIKGCRPYFIGLLGERYGWVPEEIDPALIEQEPWLEEHREKSVTELEILHGVLNDPAMADHAFFYLRDPAYAEGKPVLHEGPTDEEIVEHGAEKAERRAEERREKLRGLKKRIRDSKLPLREGYPDPQALGQLVLEDLTEVIERLYPEGSEPEPLDREAAEHEAFAQSRVRVYIGRREYFEALDAHAAGDGPPLVVLGESGSGKSALLANWAFGHRASRPDDLVLLHFIGATAYSADWAAMLRRILGELERRFGFGLEIPDEPDALRAAFANALHMAAARGRVVLILDALNQLEDRDGAPDLVWLPPEIPANVCLILSTLPGRPLDELSKRPWPTLEVEPLEPEERERLIVDYLAQSRRALSPAHVQRIAAVEQTANPLYLRALLDELRVWGEYETLGERIDHYLAAASVDDLYERILERYEQDYERDRSGLVRETMSLLWAARRGLSEAELLDLLGTDGDALPAAHWSPLHLAAEQSLVDRSGLIGFSHDYLRQASRDRYLPTPEEQRRTRLRLADYFELRDLSGRKLDELPWLLAEAEAWPRLYDLLADTEFFGAAWAGRSLEVKKLWAALETNSTLRLTDAYRPVVDVPDRYTADNAAEVAQLLGDAGHPDEALALWSHLVEHCRRTGDLARLPAALGNEAVILQARGDLDGAMALHKDIERLSREVGDPKLLPYALGNQGRIHLVRGDLGAATALFEEMERVCRKQGNKQALQDSLGERAEILYHRGDLDGALVLADERERLCRELGDEQALQYSLSIRAVIAYDRGNFEEAMALYRDQERICRGLGDKSGLQAALGNQGSVLSERGDLEAAVALYEEQERICRELGDKEGLGASLGNRGMILARRGDLNGAIALHKEEERIFRESGNTRGLVISLANQAVLLARDLNRPREALPLAERALATARKHGLAQLALQVQPILESLRSAAVRDEIAPFAREPTDLARPNEYTEQRHRATMPADSPPIEPPTPHPRADPKRASALNKQYLAELAEWQALPWWKRRTVKKPERPTGI